MELCVNSQSVSPIHTSQFTAAEICRVLLVGSVIFCKILKNKTMSEAFHNIFIKYSEAAVNTQQLVRCMLLWVPTSL